MQNEHYDLILRRVVKRLLLRATFVFNLLFFLLVTTLLFRDVVQYAQDITGPAFFVLIWGSFLILHAALAFNLLGRLVDGRVQKELEREHLKEKPKRQRIRLGDDGELIEAAEDEPLAYAAPNESEPVGSVQRPKGN